MANGESKFSINSYISIGLLFLIVGAVVGLYKTRDIALKEIRQERSEVVFRLEKERAKEIFAAIDPLRQEVQRNYLEIQRNSDARDEMTITLNKIAVTLAVMQKDIEQLRVMAERSRLLNEKK